MEKSARFFFPVVVKPSLLRDYWTLTKPKVVLLMLITSVVGMLLSSNAPIPFETFFWALTGLAGAMGGAAAFNQILDEQIDRIMKRTQNRPIAANRLTAQKALIFATLLCIVSLAILYFLVNPLTAVLTFLGVITYAFTYTVFLKRATPQNIVIGGIAGAIPPLLGWTAVTNSIHPHAWLLVLIIFVWTPPHFWALSIHRCNDYKEADIPMLPVTHGIQFTKNNIIFYTLLLILVCFLPFLTHMSGIVYLIGSTVLNSMFLYYAIKLKIDDSHRYAMKTFVFSIVHLFLLFAFLLLDHYFKINPF